MESKRDVINETAGRVRTAEDTVREVAAQYGFTHLPPEAIDSALWEHTAFPLCDEGRMREQLHEFFSRADGAQHRGNP